MSVERNLKLVPKESTELSPELSVEQFVATIKDKDYNDQIKACVDRLLKTDEPESERRIHMFALAEHVAEADLVRFQDRVNLDLQEAFTKGVAQLEDAGVELENVDENQEEPEQKQASGM